MSFLKKLFGGSADADNSNEPKVLDQEDYKGFVVKALEMRAGSEFQLCGTIEKEIDGEMKVHQFIRADRLSSAEMAASAALGKGRQIVDEQGTSVFSV